MYKKPCFLRVPSIFSIKQACLPVRKERGGVNIAFVEVLDCTIAQIRTTLKGYQCTSFLRTKSGKKYGQNLFIQTSTKFFDQPNFFINKSCFAMRYHLGIPDELKPRARYLLPGSFPTKDTVILDDMPSTARAKRRVSNNCIYKMNLY